MNTTYLNYLPLPKEDIDKIKSDIKSNEQNLLSEMEHSLRSLESLVYKYRETISNYEGIHGLEFNDRITSERFSYNITITNKPLCIQIPALLPHRRNAINIPFLEPLRQILSDYAVNNNISIKSGIIVFEFKYKNQIRDADNTECKAVIDTIVDSTLISNDNSFSLFKTCQRDNVNGTRILILSPNEFMEYLQNTLV